MSFDDMPIYLVSKDSPILLEALEGEWCCLEANISQNRLIELEHELRGLEFSSLFLTSVPRVRLYKVSNEGIISYAMLNQISSSLSTNSDSKLASWLKIEQWLVSLNRLEDKTLSAGEDEFSMYETELFMEEMFWGQEEKLESESLMNALLNTNDIARLQASDAYLSEAQNARYTHSANQQLLMLLLLPGSVLHIMYPNLKIEERLNPIVFSNNASFNSFVLNADTESLVDRMAKRFSDTQILSDGFILEELNQEIKAQYQAVKKVCQLKKMCKSLKHSLMVSFDIKNHSPLRDLWTNLIKTPLDADKFSEFGMKIFIYDEGTKDIERYLLQINEFMKVMPPKDVDFFNSCMLQCFNNNNYLQELYRFNESNMPFDYLNKSESLMNEKNKLVSALFKIETSVEQHYDQLTLEKRIEIKLSTLFDMAPYLELHFYNVWLHKPPKNMSLEEKRSVNNDLRCLVALLEKPEKHKNIHEVMFGNTEVKVSSSLMKVNRILENVDELYSASHKHQGLIKALIQSLIADEDMTDLLKSFLKDYFQDYIIFQNEKMQREIKDSFEHLVEAIKANDPSYDLSCFEGFMAKAFSFFGDSVKELIFLENIIKHAIKMPLLCKDEVKLACDLLIIELGQIVLKNKMNNCPNAWYEQCALMIIVQRYLSVLSELDSELTDLDKHLIDNFWNVIEFGSETVIDMNALENEYREGIQKNKIFLKLKKTLGRLEKFKISDTDGMFNLYLDKGKSLLDNRLSNINRVFHCEVTLSGVLRCLESPTYKKILAWLESQNTLDNQALLTQLVNDIKSVPVLRRDAIIIPDTYCIGDKLSIDSPEFISTLNVNPTFSKSSSPPSSPKKLSSELVRGCLYSLNHSSRVSPTFFIGRDLSKQGDGHFAQESSFRPAGL